MEIGQHRGRSVVGERELMFLRGERVARVGNAAYGDGSLSSNMYWVAFGSALMHSTSATASFECLVYAPMPRLAPPSGGALGRSGDTRG